MIWPQVIFWSAYKIAVVSFIFLIFSSVCQGIGVKLAKLFNDQSECCLKPDRKLFIRTSTFYLLVSKNIHPEIASITT